ncbi:MAG: hypothetical protein M3O61_15380, partial [Gemmatimonadota bacterium]|nr:hypothetical protein [Gemmatimonadota bacterium]
VKRDGNLKGRAIVHTASLRGCRADKYKVLASSSITNTAWETGGCRPPYYLFASTNDSNLKEYETLPSIADVFPGTYGNERSKRIGTGFVSTHDDLAIAFNEDALRKKVEAFLDTSNEEEARRQFTLCGQDQWNYANAKAALAGGKWRDEIRTVLYRPFDERVTVWNRHVCVHRRLEVHKHLNRDNIALLVGQAGNVVGANEWGLAFVTRQPADFNVFYRGGSAVLPMLLSSDGENGELFGIGAGQDGFKANIDSQLIELLSSHLRLKLSALDEAEKEDTYSVLDVTGYVYSILYSPTYRERYGEFLMVDFPRIPFARRAKLFLALAQEGRQLISLHLGDTKPKVEVTFPESGSDEIEQILYRDPIGKTPGRVYINSEQYFSGIDPKSWAFQIGGYQVCHKWLKDRKGEQMSFGDLARYQLIVGAIAETRTRMSRIDDLIKKHGGWPIKTITVK